MNKRFLLGMLIASPCGSLQATDVMATSVKTIPSGLTGAVPTPFVKDVAPPMNAEQTLEENLKKAVMAYTSDKDASAQTLFIQLAKAYFNALQTVSLKANAKMATEIVPVTASEEAVHEKTMPLSPMEDHANVTPTMHHEEVSSSEAKTDATEDHMNAASTMPTLEHVTTSSSEPKTTTPMSTSATMKNSTTESTTSAHSVVSEHESTPDMHTHTEPTTPAMNTHEESSK